MMDVKLESGRIANKRTRVFTGTTPDELGDLVRKTFLLEQEDVTIVDEGDGIRAYYYREDVSSTKRGEAQAGQVWEVRVGADVVKVRLDRLHSKLPGTGYRVSRPWFEGTNLKTGRQITGNRARLRVRVK